MKWLNHWDIYVFLRHKCILGVLVIYILYKELSLHIFINLHVYLHLTAKQIEGKNTSFKRQIGRTLFLKICHFKDTKPLNSLCTWSMWCTNNSKNVWNGIKCFTKSSQNTFKNIVTGFFHGSHFDLVGKRQMLSLTMGLFIQVSSDSKHCHISGVSNWSN